MQQIDTREIKSKLAKIVISAQKGGESSKKKKVKKVIAIPNKGIHLNHLDEPIPISFDMHI